MGGKMLNTKSLIILFCIFSISILSPDFSEATIDAQGYDFGKVEVGSTETTLVNIANLDITNYIDLSGISFAPDSCSDFSIETLLQPPITIQPETSVNVEISYSPSSLGECSATLRIYNGSPWPANQVTFTGIGVEQGPQLPQPDDISHLLLAKLQKIIDYTNESYIYQTFRNNEQDNLPERRLKAFKKSLGVTYHLIENGQFEAAFNKLNEIHKKTDGKPEANDFVPPEKAANLSAMLQDLIASFDFGVKQTIKKSL